MESSHVAFGDFRLDTERKVLTKYGQAVPIGHRGLILLETLLAAQGRIVSKAELMDLAWPSQSVEESNLSVQIAALRKALGPRSDGNDWIVTVPRIGYQFDPQEVYGNGEAVQPTAKLESKVDTRPSIAVLPFTNLSANPDQEFFADGMTEDIISALSRINEMFVVSRASSFALKGRALAARQVAEETGVRYILEGSVRTSANRMRISVQLTDGHSGNSIWADRYDIEVNNIFDVQDEITRKITQAMQVTLTQGESVQLWEGQTRNLKAWEKAVLGNTAFHRYSTADNAQAQRHLEEAVTLDPEFTGALALLGISHYWDARYSIDVSRPAALAKAEECASRLERLAPELPQLFTLKSTIALLHRNFDDAVKWGSLAAQRAPGDSRAHGFLGMMQIYDGQMEQALISIKLAMRHSPYPSVYLYYYQAIIYLWMGQSDRALHFAEENQWLEKDEPYSTAYLAAIFAKRGEVRKAHETVARLREINPGFGLRNIRHSELYREDDRLQQLVSALAEAGLLS